MMEKLTNKKEKHFSIFIWEMVHQYTKLSIVYMEYKWVYEKEKHVHWNVSLDDVVGIAKIPNGKREKKIQIWQNVWSAMINFTRISHNSTQSNVVFFFHKTFPKMISICLVPIFGIWYYHQNRARLTLCSFFEVRSTWAVVNLLFGFFHSPDLTVKHSLYPLRMNANFFQLLTIQ